MLKLLGATLLAVGGGLMGFRSASLLRDRVRALGELQSGLLLLEQELELNQPPLPQLMEGLELRTQGAATQLFGGCAQALRQLDREPFFAAWSRLVMEQEKLQQEEKELLIPLGQTLGRYEGAEQSRAVANLRRTLEQVLVRAEEEKSRLGRMYQSLGVAGGIFVAILLM